MTGFGIGGRCALTGEGSWLADGLVVMIGGGWMDGWMEGKEAYHFGGWCKLFARLLGGLCGV